MREGGSWGEREGLGRVRGWEGGEIEGGREGGSEGAREGAREEWRVEGSGWMEGGREEGVRNRLIEDA